MREFDFIEKLKKRTAANRALLSIGDDASVLKPRPSHRLVQSTDLLVEGVHFIRPQISWEQLGYKALAVNLSDINAMGGRSRWVHLGLALPEGIREAEVNGFFDGFLGLAKEQGVELLGGDLCRSPGPIFVSVQITGEVKSAHLKTRAGFAQADLLAVTGPLGGSSLGLYALKKNILSHHARHLKALHHQPPVLTAEAQFLARRGDVVGLMDLSDGLASDLNRLPLKNFRIQVDSLPLNQSAKAFCQQTGLDPYSFAVSGGEDYQLLVGLKQRGVDKLLSAYEKKFTQPLSIIGECNQRAVNRGKKFLLHGKPWETQVATFTHFSAASD